MWSRPLRRFASALWALLKLLLIGGAVYLGSCTTTRVILQTAPDDLPDGYATPAPSLLSEPEARALLQSEIYGPVMRPGELRVLEQTQIEMPAATATLTQWQVEAGYGAATRKLTVALILPEDADGAPVFVMQNFCPNQAVLPVDGILPSGDGGFCMGGGPLSAVMTFFFGRHIVTPPIEDILGAGFGVAAIYPSQFVPDDARAGEDVLDALFPDDPDRPGALAVWAGLFPVVADLVTEAHGERAFIATGHSRFGKTALLATAWFPEIDGAIAHQSGTLGASRLTDDRGEPLRALAESYPHWPNRRLQTYADNPASLPVRPRDLLALMADKPVLLGNAKRDVWSDPFGAFVEADAAWPGFDADAPGDFRPADRHAFWQRPGTHGVVKEDWEAFLAWASAQDWQ